MTDKPTESSSTNTDTHKDVKKHITWERGIEILKVAATVWVAGIGTIVTMQFNERQHELNRIEAIARMLPHLAVKPETGNGAKSGSDAGEHKSDMSRDGAIWAIYRTANSKTMLRDLASLFPEDIYRVVSSTAQSGGLSQDQDALTALEVSSEKLAGKYSTEHRNDLAIRLYDQTLRLKERKVFDKSPLHIVDLSDSEVKGQPGTDETATLITKVNKLGDVHLNDSEKSKDINTHHFQAKQLYKRARDLGKGSADNQVNAQVVIADLRLGRIYMSEFRWERALEYYNEARPLQVTLYGADSQEVKETDKLIEELKRKAEHKKSKSESTPNDPDD